MLLSLFVSNPIVVLRLFSCGLTVREESVGVNLGCLTTRRVVAPPEVWSVLRVAWLLWDCAARVPSHYSSVRQPVDVVVEGVAWWHICVYLWPWVISYACCIGDDLGDLPSCCLGTWSEVWSVLRVAWLLWYQAAVVPSHYSS